MARSPSTLALLTHPPLRRVPALFLSVFLVLPAALQAQDLSELQRTAREYFAELVQINTTQSVGNNTEAAEAMAAHLLDAGFPAEDIHVVVPPDAPMKGNLVARLRGRDSGLEPMLVMAHIDVVEADPADWTLPPFEFIERDGYFYGRGTGDDKDEAAIYTAILVHMKRQGFVPERDIIMALTADEEGGPNNGVQYLLANHPSLVDAAFALNEGGGGILQDGKRVSNSVQASEKKVQNYTLEVTNPGGHSSRPLKENAIYQLSAALSRLGAFDFPVNLNEVTREFFGRTAEITEDPALADAMRTVLTDPSNQEAVALIARDPALNARLRTTCVATTIEGGHARNALPQRVQANVNCRILPDESPDEVTATLNRVLDSRHVTLTPISRATDSPPSPLAPEVLEPIERITEEMWPGVPVIPSMSTGATDGLFFRNAGIPVYGVSGLFYDGADVRAHGMNERIPVESFYEGVLFLDRLVRELSSGPIS